MIRVTFDNGAIKEYQGCVWDVYDLYGGEEVGVIGIRSFFQKSRIVKFEKQVKDLTLEECYRLGVNIDTYGNYYELSGQVLGFDDYIDITSLIKENE